MKHALLIMAKIIAWLVFGVVFLSVIVFIGVFHLGFLEFGINAKLQELLAERTPLKVTIGSIEGDFFNTLVISDIEVSYDDGVFSYQIAKIPRVQTAHSLFELWRGQIDLQLLKLDSVDVVVERDPNGRWALPRIAGEEQGPRVTPSFSVDRLILEGASLTFVDGHDSLRIDSVNLAAGIEVFQSAYAIDLRSFSGVSNFHDTRLNHAQGKLTISDGRIVFKDLVVDAGTIDVLADGFFNPSHPYEGHVDLRRGEFDMGYIGDVFGKRFRGELSLTGGVDVEDQRAGGDILLTGSFQEYSFENLNLHAEYDDGVIYADSVAGAILNGCRVAGKATYDVRHPGGAYTFVGSAEYLNIANFTKGAISSDLSGKISLDGVGTSSSNMHINAEVNLRESSVDMFYGNRIDGSLEITTDSLRLNPGFALDYYGNRFTGAGLVRFGGDIDVRGSATFSDLARFNDKVFISELSGRAEASFHLSGNVSDPNISGKFYSDSLWLYEFFSERSWYEFDIERFLTGRKGSVTADLAQIRAWDFPLDSLVLSMRIDSNLLYIDKMDCRSGEAELKSAGRLDYSLEKIPIELDRSELSFFDNSYYSSGTIRLLYDTLGIDFVRLPLMRIDTVTGDTSFITGVGRANFDQAFDLRMQMRNVQLKPWVALMPTWAEIQGALSCDIGVNGSPDSLNFYGVASVDSLMYYDLEVGDISTAFEYQDDVLMLDTLQLYSSAGSHSIKGKVPLRLRLSEYPVVTFPEEQTLSVSSTEERFDFVSFFLPQVEELTGEFTLRAEVTGTPVQPRFNGEAALAGARLKIYELEIPAESLYVNLSLAGRTVSVDNGVCRFPPKRRKYGRNEKFRSHEYGSVSLGGSLKILSIDSIDYNLTLQAENVPANYTLGAFTGKADAKLRVTGLTPPTVSGDVSLINGLYEEEFLEEDAGYVLLSSFEKPDSWDVNVDVEMKSNARVRNTDIDGEFKGRANLRRIDGLWYYIYNLEVIRGRIFLPFHTFRLDPGGTVINSDNSENNPDLNLTARTKMRVRQVDILASESARSDQKVAAIKITGDLEHPLITYYDDPALSANEKIPPDQLYATLAAGYQIEDVQGRDIVNRGSEALASLFSSEVSRVGARTIGVETFDIDPDLDIGRTEVTLGLYAMPWLYTYGKSDIGVTGQEVGFEAYIAENVVFQGRRDALNHYFFFLNYGLDF